MDNNVVYRVWYLDDTSTESYEDFNDAEMALICEEMHQYNNDYVRTEDIYDSYSEIEDNKY